MEPKIGALALTIIDMTIVFAVLWGLALLINLTKWLVGKGEKKEAGTPAAVTESGVQPGPEKAGSAPEGPSPALLAAITAAVAAYLDQGTANITISAIKRFDSGESWASVGRLENVARAGSIQMRRFS